MGQSAIIFKSGDLKLEGVVGCPDGEAGPFPRVVLCHPNPRSGGDMNNNLVLSVYFALIEKGFAALRFNFRGVGNSDGTHSQGEREPEDAEAALDSLKGWGGVDGNRLGMAGYSFGTGVILGSLSRYASARSFVLFSSAVRYLESPGLERDGRPMLFVCGDADHGIPIKSLAEKVEALKQPSNCRVVEGADHYWLGHEEEAAQHAVQFFNETLKH